MNPSIENPQNPAACLCGSGLPYAECCGPLHKGTRQASTAEQLMRSRFSAYARRDAMYLSETWDATTRPAKIDFSHEDVEWTRLEIVSRKKGAANDRKGIVEFKAYYVSDDKEHVMREISRFRKVDRRWFYLDGAVRSIAKVGESTNFGRNAPCACGSGKKAKRCCGATE